MFKLKLGARLLVLAISFLSTPAVALKGTYLPSRAFPENVCKIGFFSQGATLDPEFVCSASVISKKRLLTAAHCDVNLKNYPDAYVLCGEIAGLSTFGFGPKVKGHVRSPYYLPPNSIHDIAVFELDSPLPDGIVPVSLSTSIDQETQFSRDASRCEIFGFGMNNFNQLGSPEGVMFQPQSGATGAPPYAIVSGPNRAAPGDSGGPVLCPLDTQGTRWTQIALTISIPADETQVSYHALLIPDLEWLKGVMNQPVLPNGN